MTERQPLRKVDYTGFKTIKEDLTGNIARERLQILQAGRTSMTLDLAANPDFQRELISARAEAALIRTSPAAEITKAALPRLVKETCGDHLDQTNIDILHLPEIAETMSDYAALVAPVYMGFARHLHEQAKEAVQDSENTVYLFGGRDSFPFMLGMRAYQELKEEEKQTEADERETDAEANKGQEAVPGRIIFAPFNRLNFQRLFTPEGQDPFIHDLSDYHNKHQIPNKDLFVIDFGFIGSLERIAQIVLPPEEQPAHMHHVLFSALHKQKEPWFLDNLAAAGFDTSKDKPYVQERISGYINSLLQKFPENEKLNFVYHANMKTTDEWKPFLNPFMLFFQEMGSGINESRQDGLHHGDEKAFKETHLKYASLQQIVGLHAFLEGLQYSLKRMNQVPSDAQVTESLIAGCEEFYANKPFYEQFIPQEDRRHIEGLSTHPSFETVTRKLAELNTLPISTVKFK